MRYSIPLVFLCLLVGGFCQADRLVLTNGDRVTGKLDSLREGRLRFKSQLMGEITVDVENVRTFSTDEAVEIHFSDGTAINRKILSDKPGKVSIGTGGIVKSQAFNIEDIVSINYTTLSADETAQKKPSAAEKEVKPAKWKGSISAGLSSSHGNTRTEDRNLSVDLSKRRQDDRITFKADYARGEQEDPDTGKDNVTENWWRAKAKYDYFLTKKGYVYGQGRYGKDSIAELDRRVIIGGGVGYQWVESDVMNFSTEVGLSSLYEKFDDQTESNSEVSAELGYHFDRKFWKEYKFINDLSYYPSTENPSDYLLSSTAEIRASITENMFSNFRVIFDYDSNPAEDSDKTDVKYIFGVGWNFE